MKRRLVLMLLWLILFDRFVPALLDVAERRHYEQTNAFRFENSDLFGLGPLVQYLREHPRREHRRVVFFGNSMIWGYFLTPEQAMPAQFQALVPDARVYNAAINGQEMGTGYLVAKDILDDVDVLYIQDLGTRANPMLPSLIPIDDADLHRFGLEAPDRVEARLQSWLGSVWNLDRLNYRIQAALFGTSTRVYVYMHKRDIVARLLRRPSPPPTVWPPVTARISLRAPVAPASAPAGPAASSPPMMTDLAALARARGKRVVFIRFEWDGSAPTDAEVAAFNAAYAPSAEIVIVHLPKETTFDGEHPVPGAATQIAEALARHEAGR
ncbi:MAG TPA: hypothetical protein VG323_09600 [Thermoanaerobaculia bacterium]|nr:hypothetical protein [Thermoanaerobaculia bacterium]